MEGRALLGAADVADDELVAIVGDLLGRRPRALAGVTASEVAYDVPAITTAGRYRVRGTAVYDDGDRPFSLFVKVVQSWTRSPLFASVPEELRAFAARAVPWRTEAAVYRSDLADRLPPGLAMPRALEVRDLDDSSTAIWLEDLTTRPVTWDLGRHRDAAYLLGRLAASPAVAPLADVGGFEWTVTTYVEGRVSQQVLPILRDPAVWDHPLVAGSFEPELRERLLAVAGRVDALGEELLAMPVLTGHGDACVNNLLHVEGREELVLIDFGFWKRLPVGFDLGQLLVGDVQIGRRRAADLGGLAAVDEQQVAAYVAGLRAEGCEIPAEVVLRAHALQLMVFTGLSALPAEHLGSPVTPALRALADDRAALARYCVDLLDLTEP